MSFSKQNINVKIPSMGTIYCLLFCAFKLRFLYINNTLDMKFCKNVSINVI